MHTVLPYWLCIHILLSLTDWISDTDTYSQGLGYAELQNLDHRFCYVTDIAEWSLYAKAICRTEACLAAIIMAGRHNTFVVYFWLDSMFRSAFQPWQLLLNMLLSVMLPCTFKAPPTTSVQILDRSSENLTCVSKIQPASTISSTQQTSIAEYCRYTCLPVLSSHNRWLLQAAPCQCKRELKCVADAWRKHSAPTCQDHKAEHHKTNS